MMKLEPRLLRALVAHQKDPRQIWSLFCEAGMDATRLRELNSVADSVTPYSRVVLSDSPECEIMLARWAPERICAPHDHGTSAGWVFYFDQEFEEYAYKWREGELVQHATHRHLPGSYTQVVKNEIHSCKTSGSGMSLHIYFPRIEKMRVFDIEGRKTLVVSDNCGAWIPREPEQVVKETAWNQ